MTNFNLNISGTEIPVALEKHRRFRRCSMRITDHGLRVTVPSICFEHEWRGFIDKHRRWIHRTYSKHKTRLEKLPKLEAGAKIPFKGDFYIVKGIDSGRIEFTGDSLLVPASLLHHDSAEQLLEKLVDIYLSEAEKLLRKFIERWEDHLRNDVRAFKLKEMRSRWGSCSSKGNIAINWRLIMAPEEVFEYVFVHELCHIETKGHNRKFWHSVESRLPGTIIWRKLLRKNNYMLMNFPFSVGNHRTLRTVKWNSVTVQA